MIELPEAAVIAGQAMDTICGKKILKVVVAQSPHKFAWYHGNPQDYHDLLADTMLEKAAGFGSMVEIKAGNAVILFGEGIGLRYHEANAKRPQKHQLLIEFTDSSAISATVQMYGGLWCFREGEFHNIYYQQAKIRPSPLTDQFDKAYYDSILSTPGIEGLSVKALLATEQRIPGLGNGVLQDILYNAGTHPKRKVKTLTIEEKDAIFDSLKFTLSEMTYRGGRDIEKDLLGHPGGYRTKVSKNTAGRPCPVCGAIIKKEAYMGGSIYFCPGCQK